MSLGVGAKEAWFQILASIYCVFWGKLLNLSESASLLLKAVFIPLFHMFGDAPEFLHFFSCR